MKEHWKIPRTPGFGGELGGLFGCGRGARDIKPPHWAALY